MSSRRSGHQQPQWVPHSDGFWRLVPGDDETRYYRRVDGQMHQVPRILDTTASSNIEHREKLLQYLIATSFYNNLGELVEVTRAIITTPLHFSGCKDPNAAAGPHMGVQLTNATLINDSGKTHLLHFRPHNPDSSYFYNRAITREQVAGLQAQRYINRFIRKDDKDRKGGSGGGDEACGSSSGKGGRRSDGVQQHSGGYSSSSGDNYQSGGGYGYSHAGQYYSVGLLQVWRGILNYVAYQGMIGILLKMQPFSQEESRQTTS
ncbi:hypothetical protein F5Y09DRAFT_353778 [Xylaria sp. FL1042]|nr:hypothetical protein F5Y09DRAFT_353778 [Xylaria sp. FL1042]